MTIKVNITPEDIRLAERDSKHCPICRAINRTVNKPHSKVVIVDDQWGYFEHSNEVFYLPDKAVEFSKKYFSREAVEPTSFEMEIPEKLGGIFSKAA